MENNNVIEPEKVTTHKNPSRVNTGKRLVQYNRNKKLEKLNQIAKDDVAQKSSMGTAGYSKYLYMAGLALIGGTVLYYHHKSVISPSVKTKVALQSTIPSSVVHTSPTIPQML